MLNHFIRKNTLEAGGLQGTPCVGIILVNYCPIASYKTTGGCLWNTLDEWDLVPPGLGSLSSLERLYLNSNKLSGPIPPELGSLSSLAQFSLSVNRLSGPIPPELASLSSLQRLWLYSNDLSGPILPEFGKLSSLELLRLESSGLQGPVPPELGELSALRILRLSNNARLSGLLPSSFTALSGLDELLAGGTDLCAPSDAGFLEWLASIYKLRLARCTDATVSTAYVTQVVQSTEFPVPLLAGEEGLLRVFVTAAGSNSEGIPPVRATLYRDGSQVHQVEIPGKPGPIPIRVSEGDLGASANARIPAEVIQPGLEMVIEVDLAGTLDPELGVVKRIPETGRLAVDVRAMPVLDLTLIPLLWEEKPERAVVDLIKGMAADPEGHDLLSETRLLLPVTSLSVKDHAPVVTSTNNTSLLLSEVSAIRVMEGGTGHYMGIMDRFEEWGGRAYRPGRVSVSRPNASTMAHELGHNMSLQHAPCGGAENPDLSFPYAGGPIGAWGYDFSQGGKLVPPSRSDLMSYCDPAWISDYHLANALGFRLLDEVTDTVRAEQAPGRSLLLWGGVDARGIPYLDPAFVIDAPPALPDSTGEYQLVGQTTDRREIFSLDFTMPEVADGDGSSGFAFALPVQPGWAGTLASITLSGPGGMATQDGDTNRPITIFRDPQTGQVRGIIRDFPLEALAQADVAGGLPSEPELRVLGSRGIPNADAWRR